MGGHMDQGFPISKTSSVPPWNTCRSVWPPSEIPFITVSFNSVRLMVSSALFPQISRRPESLSIVNLVSSESPLLLRPRNMFSCPA
ncbi:hypothetical protein TNCV_827101 [Trichonephila clavipes]|nr:hypothetical protein TNCV_827101 [Trichonephila clavipes]